MRHDRPNLTARLTARLEARAALGARRIRPVPRGYAKGGYVPPPHDRDRDRDPDPDMFTFTTPAGVLQLPLTTVAEHVGAAALDAHEAMPYDRDDYTDTHTHRTIGKAALDALHALAPQPEPPDQQPPHVDH